MAQWRIKEVSDLTGISVRMLRYYNTIGLLKPSFRLRNEYRSYSEHDLAMLQQIIALKYFGFSLKDIKGMMEKSHTIAAHLQAQAHALKAQAEHLHELSQTLDEVLARLPPSGIPEASDFLTLIKRYRMTEKLKQGWAGKNLNPEQFADYVAICEQYPEEFAAWDQLMDQINKGELSDPEGPDGERVVTFQLEILEKTKATLKEQRHLGSQVLADIKSGRISKLQLSPEGSLWLARAGLAYVLKRWEGIYEDLVKSLGKSPEGPAGKTIADAWRALIELMLSASHKEIAIGTMLWQVSAQQKIDFDEAKEAPTPKDLVKKVHVKLLFNPDAMKWLEEALVSHPVKN